MFDSLMLSIVSLSWNGQPVFMLLFLLAEWLHIVLALLLLILAVFLLSDQGTNAFQTLSANSIRKRKIERTLTIGCVGLCIWYLLLKCAEYIGLGLYDTATMHLYSIWNNSKDLFLSDFFVRGHSHIGDHFEPITALYSPIAWITKSPALIILINTAACVSSVGIFNRILKSSGYDDILRWSLVILFFSNFYFQTVLHFFFSISSLAIPLFLLVILFWTENRIVLLYVAAGFFLGVKEEAGLVLSAFAIACLLSEKSRERRIQAAWLLVFSLAGFFGSMAIVRRFSAPFDLEYNRWENFLGLPNPEGGLFKVYLKAPFQLFWKWAWPFSKFLSFLQLLISAAGLAFLFPAGFLALILGNFHHQIAFTGHPYHTYEDYYSAFIIPLLFWATAKGALVLTQKLKTPQRKVYLLSIILAVSAVNIIQAPLPGHYRKEDVEKYQQAWELILEARRRPTASIITSQYFQYPLAFRKQLGFLEEKKFIPDLVLYNRGDVMSGKVALLQDGLFRQHSYAPIVIYPSIVLLERLDSTNKKLSDDQQRKNTAIGFGFQSDTMIFKPFAGVQRLEFMKWP